MSRKRSVDEPKLEDYIGLFRQSRNKRDELEVRFGTKYYNPITKIKFNNALKKMKSIGFIQIEAESYHLNIQNEYIDPNTGKTKLSNIRLKFQYFHYQPRR